MLLFIQLSGNIQKRNGIPGIPADSSIGYMYIGKSDLNKNLINTKKNSFLFLKPSSSQAAYFEGFNPLIFGVLIFIILTFIFVLGLTINSKAQLFVKKKFPNRIKTDKYYDMELALPDENSPLPTPVDLESKYDLRRYPESSVHKELELMDIQVASSNSQILLTNERTVEKSQFDINTKLQRNKKIKQKETDNIISIKTNKKLQHPKSKNISVNKENPAAYNVKNVYSTKQIQNYLKRAKCSQDVDLCASEKYPSDIHMELFVDSKNIQANIHAVTPLLLGLVSINDINTVEILLFKLCTMLVNPEENCYVFHPVLCKLIENYFSKGTVIKHFFLTNNYLLQDSFVSCILGYFNAHLNFPILGNTSFISFRFHSIKKLEKDPFCHSPTLLLNMFLDFHINFKETSNNKIEKQNFTHQLLKLNAFLENALAVFSNKSDNVNEMILNFITSVELVMNTITKKTFIYLQSILRIYNNHLLCCIKKKDNVHISLNTDKKLFEILTLILDTNNLTINIKKLIQAIALLLGKHNCPFEFINKLEIIINKENVKSNNCKKNNKLPLMLINRTPGSWI